MSYTKEEYKKWLSSKPAEYRAELRDKKVQRSAQWYRENKKQHNQVCRRNQKRWYEENHERERAKHSVRYARSHGQPWARMPAFYSFAKEEQENGKTKSS